MTAIAADNVSVSLAARDLQVTAGSKVFCLPVVTFGNGTLTYPAGGVPLPGIGQFGFKRQIDRLLICQAPDNGYVYKYDADNKKIQIFVLGQAPAEGDGYTVEHAATPAGNEVYLKYTDGGTPYLCCNMANDTENKVLSFTDGKVSIVHDATASSGGLALYFDEDGAAGAQLLVNNTVTGADAYVPTTTPGYALKVGHDADADTNGAAITYDDDASENLEANFADGEDDVDLVLTAVLPGKMTEMAATAAPAEVSLACVAIGE